MEGGSQDYPTACNSVSKFKMYVYLHQYQKAPTSHCALVPVKIPIKISIGICCCLWL